MHIVFPPPALPFWLSLSLCTIEIQDVLQIKPQRAADSRSHHQASSIHPTLSDSLFWVCAPSDLLSHILSWSEVLSTFQPIVTKCGVIYLTLWDLGFDLSGVTPLGGISHAPIVNLPILFTNTGRDKQPARPARIASDIICLNLLKAHVDCRSLEWPWCVTLTVHCQLKFADYKVIPIVFSSPLGPLCQGSPESWACHTWPPSSPQTHAPVKLISPIPTIIFRDVVGQKLPTKPRTKWPSHAAKAFHILTSLSSGFSAILLKSPSCS